MKGIVELAKALRRIFEDCCGDLEIPFFYSFPENSCEGASVFFGHIVKVFFPEAKVDIVKGFRIFSEYDTGYHFWVEVNGRVFDLTSDQFDESVEAVINGHIIEKHIGFSIECRQDISEYLVYYLDNRLEPERFIPIRKNLISRLKTCA